MYYLKYGKKILKKKERYQKTIQNEKDILKKLLKIGQVKIIKLH